MKKIIAFSLILISGTVQASFGEMKCRVLNAKEAQFSYIDIISVGESATPAGQVRVKVVGGFGERMPDVLCDNEDVYAQMESNGDVYVQCEGDGDNGFASLEHKGEGSYRGTFKFPLVEELPSPELECQLTTI